MTLHEYPTIEQGSEAWFDQRRGLVTASVVGKLVTAKTFRPADNDEARGLTALLVAERITGHTEPTHMTDDMWRGVQDEPVARETYSEHYAEVRETGFMVRDDWGWSLGYSPDGLVGDDGLIEIKSRRQKKHLQTILADEVPAENVAQLQCGLLVSGREWIDYVSYCGGMPLYVKRVEPDLHWRAAIVDAVGRFEQNAQGMWHEYGRQIKGLVATEREIHLDMVI